MQQRSPRRASLRRRGRGRPLERGLMAVAIALCAVADARAQERADPLPPLAVEIARVFGIGEGDEEKLRAGEIVSSKLPEKMEKELRVGVAMLLPASAKRIFEQLASGRILSLDETILAIGDIPKPAAPLGALAGFALPPAELANLRQVKPGSIFNLATDEIEGLQKRLETETDDAALQDAFRRILAGRVQAFAKKGLDGVAPYDRGDDDPAHPAEELRHANTTLEKLREAAPDFAKALDSPPGSVPDVDEHFRWRLQQIQDRPTAVLERRLALDRFDAEHGYGLLASQRFYASQSFNSLLIAVGMFQYGEKTLVFYSNQTFTDQVAGFGSSAAHAIGRKFMLSEIVKLFESVRDSELAKGS